MTALPGAAAVTGGLVPVLAGSNWGTSVLVEGFDAGPDTDTNSRYNEVAPGLLLDDGHSAAGRPGN